MLRGGRRGWLHGRDGNSLVKNVVRSPRARRIHAQVTTRDLSLPGNSSTPTSSAATQILEDRRDNECWWDQDGRKGVSPLPWTGSGVPVVYGETGD